MADAETFEPSLPSPNALFDPTENHAGSAGIRDTSIDSTPYHRLLASLRSSDPHNDASSHQIPSQQASPPPAPSFEPSAPISIPPPASAFPDNTIINQTFSQPILPVHNESTTTSLQQNQPLSHAITAEPTSSSLSNLTMPPSSSPAPVALLPVPENPALPPNQLDSHSDANFRRLLRSNNSPFDSQPTSTLSSSIPSGFVAAAAAAAATTAATTSVTPLSSLSNSSSAPVPPPHPAPPSSRAVSFLTPPSRDNLLHSIPLVSSQPPPSMTSSVTRLAPPVEHIRILNPISPSMIRQTMTPPLRTVAIRGTQQSSAILESELTNLFLLQIKHLTEFIFPSFGAQYSLECTTALQILFFLRFQARNEPNYIIKLQNITYGSLPSTTLASRFHIPVKQTKFFLMQCWRTILQVFHSILRYSDNPLLLRFLPSSLSSKSTQKNTSFLAYRNQPWPRYDIVTTEPYAKKVFDLLQYDHALLPTSAELSPKHRVCFFFVSIIVPYIWAHFRRKMETEHWEHYMYESDDDEHVENESSSEVETPLLGHDASHSISQSVFHRLKHALLPAFPPMESDSDSDCDQEDNSPTLANDSSDAVVADPPLSTQPTSTTPASSSTSSSNPNHLAIEQAFPLQILPQHTISTSHLFSAPAPVFPDQLQHNPHTLPPHIDHPLHQEETQRGDHQHHEQHPKLALSSPIASHSTYYPVPSDSPSHRPSRPVSWLSCLRRIGRRGSHFFRCIKYLCYQACHHIATLLTGTTRYHRIISRWCNRIDFMLRVGNFINILAFIRQGLFLTLTHRILGLTLIVHDPQLPRGPLLFDSLHQSVAESLFLQFLQWFAWATLVLSNSTASIYAHIPSLLPLSFVLQPLVQLLVRDPAVAAATAAPTSTTENSQQQQPPHQQQPQQQSFQMFSQSVFTRLRRGVFNLVGFGPNNTSLDDQPSLDALSSIQTDISSSSTSRPKTTPIVVLPPPVCSTCRLVATHPCELTACRHVCCHYCASILLKKKHVCSTCLTTVTGFVSLGKIPVFETLEGQLEHEQQQHD